MSKFELLAKIELLNKYETMYFACWSHYMNQNFSLPNS